MIIEEIGINRFVDSSIVRVLREHINRSSSESLRIFACDARVLYLISKKNKFIYHPYLEASYILPDGRPIFWLLKLSGKSSLHHFTGPNLMKMVLSDPELKKKKHMFYGGSQETITRLKEVCLLNDINVVDAFSPPYLQINSLDIEDVNRRLKEFKPEFFWCGLGAPKQEFLLHQLDRDSSVVMAGVGLAFNYYVGTVREAPKVLSKIGLEWIVRYSQQPKRIKRFVRPFIYTLTIIVKQLVRVGLKRLRS